MLEQLNALRVVLLMTRICACQTFVTYCVTEDRSCGGIMSMIRDVMIFARILPGLIAIGFRIGLLQMAALAVAGPQEMAVRLAVFASPAVAALRS